MAFSEKKRFVAGAVCPRCSEMDKLVVYHQDEKDFRECVACGFKEEMRLNVAASELPTRVTPVDADKNTVQIIQLIDKTD